MPTEPMVPASELETSKAQIADLQQRLRQTSAALGKSKRSKAEYVAAVYEAIRDGLSTVELAPVPAPFVSRGIGSPEVAVAVLSDWQLGKVTPTYNSQVCEQRIGLYAEKVLRLTDIQRKDHPVDEARVWVLGDIIEGITIFPGQQWLVDSSLYRQITIDGPRILGNFLRQMLANFKTVHVTAIIGNHGRLGKWGEYDPESNADRMVYSITRQLLAAESRLTWTIPEGQGERHWYAVDRVGEYSSFLFHGDQLGGRMQGALTIPAIQRKVNGWKAGSIPEHFDDAMCGHWHQNMELTLNNSIFRCAGSPESLNTFAQEALAALGRPSQRLMFVHPEHGHVSAEYKVWLTKERAGLEEKVGRAALEAAS